ncbi:MAG: hydroxyethylthiazole kinase [Verrucomicrobia bacterium]|nr:hydroxyethylthiazole kinase [Verrucomicrobiota bacterium]
MTSNSLVEAAVAALGAIRARRPLVHNITNYVVMNSTANTLLSLGASPVMAHAIEEVEEFAAMAGALVLNIGTLSGSWIDAMVRAGRAAKAAGVPVVLDPVGAGATRLRTETSVLLLREAAPSVIRGNASEILALGAAGGGGKGVDAAHTVDQARAAAVALARASGAVVAVTGAEDFVTDGRTEVRVANGHALMARITGTGCAASAVTGAFCAVERDPLAAAAAALIVFGIAGEMAAVGEPRPGTYQVRLLDALDAVDAARVAEGARVRVAASAA